MSDWFSSSYMAKRGVAGGRVGEDASSDRGQTRLLSICLRALRRAGPHHSARATSSSPKRSTLLAARSNPSTTGPLRSSSSRSSIRRTGRSRSKARRRATSYACASRRIVPRGPQPAGTSALIPEFGGLVGNAGTPMLNAAAARAGHEVPRDRKTACASTTGSSCRSSRSSARSASVPKSRRCSRCSRTIGAATWTCLTSRPGAIAYFPVQTKGAYLFLGDCHGRQGDGELCGVAVEIPSTTTIQVDLIKSWPILWPRLENERFIMTIGSARPMEDAARIAYRELIRWLVGRLRFRRDRSLFSADAGGQDARRQHGRSQIHFGRFDSERLSAVQAMT